MSPTAPASGAGEPAVITIRRLGAGDAERYRAFRLDAIRRTPTAFTSSFEEEVAKPLEATLDRLVAPGRPRDAVFGACDGERRLVGIAGLAVPTRRQESHKGTLFGMAVAPGWTGRGIGTSLVHRVLDHAAAVGLTQVSLTVSESNDVAERLYRSCGFETWGREPSAVVVADTPIAKLHMVCTLALRRRPCGRPDGR